MSVTLKHLVICDIKIKYFKTLGTKHSLRKYRNSIHSAGNRAEWQKINRTNSFARAKVQNMVKLREKAITSLIQRYF